MKQLTRDSLLSVFLCPLIICLAFLAIIATKRTIAPVDLYWAAPGYYKLGTPERVHNHYISDLTNVSIPVKYYLINYAPERCQTQIGALGLAREVSGYRLPQGDCYPFGAVRPYLQLDSILALSKFFSFFTAYDLSHMFLLLALYFAAFFLFCQSLPRIYAALGAALLSTSFPAARDLQYDTFETGLPFLLLAIVFTIQFARSKAGYQYLAAAFLAFSVSFMRVSMQGLAQNAIFLTIYLGVFHIPEARALWRSSTKRALFLVAGLAAIGIGVAFHSGGIFIFLNNTEQFVPDRNLPVLTMVLRKTLAWLLSFGHFFGGELLMSFKTFDPMKLLQTLGGREYPSYDWASFFLNPVVSIFFLMLVIQRPKKLSAGQRSVLKLGLVMMAIDLLLILLPTYRFIYLRLHAFLLATTVAFVFATLISDLKINLSHRSLLKVIVPAIALMFIGGGAMMLFRQEMLERVRGHGTFGFDPAFWPYHINYAIARLTFQDSYTWLFFAAGIGGVILLRARQWPALIALVTASGLALNAFQYTKPMKRELFYSFLQEFKGRNYNSDGRMGRGIVTMPNINLLLNRPVPWLYESLEIKTGGK